MCKINIFFKIHYSFGYVLKNVIVGLFQHFSVKLYNDVFEKFNYYIFKVRLIWLKIIIECYL